MGVQAGRLVSYGGISGGLRSVQMTKQLVTTLEMVPLVEAVAIPLVARYVDAETGVVRPEETQAKAARVMLDELVRWGLALKPMRTP